MPIVIRISGCGISYLDTLPQVFVQDTLEKFCPGITSSCSNPASPLIGHYKRVVTDIVTLPSCGALRISIAGLGTETTVNLLNQVPWGPDYSHVIINTQNPGYTNSSPIIPNTVPLIVYYGAVNDIPFPLTDPDNDSLVATSVQPRYDSGAVLPYATGFSLSAPFGTGSSMTYNQTTKSWNIQTSIIGNFSVCIEIDEYRNGQKIASSLRNYEMLSLSTATFPDFPVAGVPLHYSTCPGQINNIPLTFTDPTATDSVFVIVDAPVIPGFTFVTSTAPALGIGTANISWTTPATVDPATLPFFTFNVTTYDNNCPKRSLARYAVIVRVKQCNTDTVWAGDANADYAVTNLDPLAVAVAYNKTGPVRPGATTLWQPEYCLNWNDTFANGVNMKHADCNGDGVVDSTDLNAITLNWGNIHAKGSGKLKTTAVPDLYFDVAGISFVSGNNVSIPIKLGTSSFPMNNVYGLGTTINIDGITPTTAPTITFPSGWLGNSTNTLKFTKTGSTTESINWAYARTNQQNVSGNGTIAMLNFTVPSGINTPKPITISFNNTQIVDNKLNLIPATAFNELDATVMIIPVGIGSLNDLISQAVVLPNPSDENAVLQLTLAEQTDLTITIADVTGRIVHRQAGKTESGSSFHQLPTVSSGLYLIKLSANGASKTIKWLRN